SSDLLPSATQPAMTTHAPINTTATATGPTERASLPPAPRSGRARRYWIALGVTLALAVACGTAAALIPTPYATLSPGRARAVEQLVTVRGADVHPPAGSILFLTVGVDDDVTLFEAAAGWLDRDVD